MWIIFHPAMPKRIAAALSVSSVSSSWCVDDDGVGRGSGGLQLDVAFYLFGPIVGHLAFDDTGPAANPSGRQEPGEKVVPELREGGDQQLRGKGYPVWWWPLAGAVAGRSGDRKSVLGTSPEPDERHMPRRAQMRRVGGVTEKPTSSSKRSQAPRAAAPLRLRATCPSPSQPAHPNRVRRPAGRHLVGPAGPPEHLRDAREGEALVEPASDERAHPCVPGSRSGPASHVPPAPRPVPAPAPRRGPRSAPAGLAGPCEHRPRRPVASQAWCHRCTEQTLTRSRFEITSLPCPAANTLPLPPECARENARRSAVRPPPRGYLMTPAYCDDHQTSALTTPPGQRQ